MGSFKFTSNISKFDSQMEKNLDVALKDIGKFIQKEAAENAPVKTGALRSSIDYQVSGDELQVGSDLDYAAKIELGDSKVNAQPFLEPAAINNRDRLKKIAEKAFSKGW